MFSPNSPPKIACNPGKTETYKIWPKIDSRM